MAFEYNDAKKETGVDVSLNIQGLFDDIPVTNVSFTEEVDTSEVQFNQAYTSNIAVTGVSYSGSFEVAGRNNTLRDFLWSGNSPNQSNKSPLPRYIDAMSITDGSDKAYIFREVLITSHSKDAPADDRTTDSYDFVAQRMLVTNEFIQSGADVLSGGIL